jgi:hypothetical protein
MVQYKGTDVFELISSCLSDKRFNPLHHGVLARFYLTAGGLLRPPEEDDISREKTILMT